MRDLVIRPTDVFEIIKKQKKLLTAVFTIAFASIMTLFLFVPRSYRSEVVVHIGVSYFQNPLIGDLSSQTHDPGELRAERERVIKAALGVEFANKMGEKYKLFKTAADDSARAVEVEYFLKSLDISPVTTTQFSIKYKGRPAQTVNGIIHDAVSSIRETMYANRIQMLEEFYSVLQSEITNAGGMPATRSIPNKVNTDERIAQERQQVGAQIQVLEKRLSDMQRAYNPNHPSVQAISTEIAELQNVQRGGHLSSRLTRRKFTRSGKATDESTIKDDLTKQEHLLNISLEMEKKDPTMSSYVTLVKEPIYPKNPVFPKLRLFLLSALITGLMAATAAVAFLEFWQRSEVTPEELAKALSTEKFGLVTIPVSHS